MISKLLDEFCSKEFLQNIDPDLLVLLSKKAQLL